MEIRELRISLSFWAPALGQAFRLWVEGLHRVGSVGKSLWQFGMIRFGVLPMTDVHGCSAVLAFPKIRAPFL